MGVWDIGQVRTSHAMFYNAQKGLFEQHQVSTRTNWEIARWVSAIVINPHVKKNISPKDICKFPWERKSAAKNKEELEKIYKEAELFKKIIESKENG